MEALAQVLSCPVCLELFTPPVLLLPCTHNFCKKCLDEILVQQNCNVSGQFSCPMCRKVIHLRGRGITGLPRNTLVESILEKFKYELENLHIKEQNHLSQICKEHGEIMNLLCLTEDKPICAICKLFGEHESHSVAKISKVYAERKSGLVKDLDRMFQQSQYAEQAKKDIEEKMDDLTNTIADVKAMIDGVGASLLKGIQWRMSELKAKLVKDYSAKLEKLQLVANELQVPSHLHHQMKTLLEKHSNSVCFLQDVKLLRNQIEKFIDGNLLQDTKYCNISVDQYFKDLIRGIHITHYISSNSEEIIASSNEPSELFRPYYPAFSFSDEASNESFCQKVLEFFQKSNKVKEDITQKVPLSDGTDTPNGTHFSLDTESASRLKPIYE